MRTLLSGLSVTLVLSGTLLAQNNEFGIYPDSTTFTSRSGIVGADAGDILVQVGKDQFRAVGQLQSGATVVGRVNGFRVLLQDQDSSTASQYTHVILADDGTGQPDLNAAELLRTGPITQPAGGGGPAAWLITNTLATPADVIPKEATFYYGIGIPGDPAWTADGLSVHAASYDIGTLGDNPVAGAATYVVSITRPTAGPPVVNPAPSPRTQRLYLLTEGPVLNVGTDIAATSQRGPNPCFGAAGSYPDSLPPREDGIAVRYRDIAAGGGSVVVFASTGHVSPGLKIGVIQGLVYLDIVAYLLEVTTGPIPTGGEFSVVFVPQPFAFPPPYLTFQAAALPPAGLPRMSNTAGRQP